MTEYDDIFTTFFNYQFIESHPEDKMSIYFLNMTFKCWHHHNKIYAKTKIKCCKKTFGLLKIYLTENKNIKCDDDFFYGLKIKDIGNADELEGEL